MCRKEGRMSENFRVFHSSKNGTLFQGDSLEWLKSLKSESVDLIFADPPYNIRKAEWDKFESREAYMDWSIRS